MPGWGAWSGECERDHVRGGAGRQGDKERGRQGEEGGRGGFVFSGACRGGRIRANSGILWRIVARRGVESRRTRSREAREGVKRGCGLRRTRSSGGFDFSRGCGGGQIRAFSGDFGRRAGRRRGGWEDGGGEIAETVAWRRILSHMIEGTPCVGVRWRRGGGGAGGWWAGASGAWVPPFGCFGAGGAGWTAETPLDADGSIVP